MAELQLPFESTEMDSHKSNNYRRWSIRRLGTCSPVRSFESDPLHQIVEVLETMEVDE